MEIIWKKQSGASSCILFFNGWGMDENVVSHMPIPQEKDLCIIQDYSSIEELPEELEIYTEIYVVAWSIGVFVGEYLVGRMRLSIQKSIAVNGTPYPITEPYGIPLHHFIKTMQHWNDANRVKFEIRMFGGNAQREANLARCSQYSASRQKKGLELIYNMHHQVLDSCSRVWSMAFVGNRDMIIPTERQKSYWKGTSTQINRVNMPHYPFGVLDSWDKIIF